MSGIPRLQAPDSTLALLREGYRFVPRRCRRLGTKAFRTRLIGQPIICMSGREAAEMFYGGDRMTRRRAIPRPTMTLLQDFGSVAGLDGEAHAHRKAMFMAQMTEESIGRLSAAAEREWERAAGRWERDGGAVLDDQLRFVHGRAVCAWTGVPLGEAEAEQRCADLAAMFDGAGGIGPRQVRGQLARRRGEAWVRRVVDGIRTGRLAVPEDSPAHAFATHRGLDGSPLTTDIVAVELINLLRPTVAVGRFVTFAALALHQHPQWRERVRGDADARRRFVLEVRRTAPFFPGITGRVRRPFSWHGHDFAEGQWVMLDIYGTNRDPDAWTDPERFDPDRFDGEPDPFALIPQGGGAFDTDHRCAGEWATIALMELGVRFLAERLDYAVPPQNLDNPCWRMPSRPASGFVIADVRRT